MRPELVRPSTPVGVSLCRAHASGQRPLESSRVGLLREYWRGRTRVSATASIRMCSGSGPYPPSHAAAAAAALNGSWQMAHARHGQHYSCSSITLYSCRDCMCNVHMRARWQRNTRPSSKRSLRKPWVARGRYLSVNTTRSAPPYHCPHS